MKNANAWVVVADKSAARIFEADTPTAALREIHDLTHPEAHMKAKEKYTGERGRFFDDAGPQRSAADLTEGPVREENLSFARRITETLDRARQENRFAKLYLAASPEFLGMLRESFSSPLRELVAEEYDKNWVEQRPEELRKHLPERL